MYLVGLAFILPPPYPTMCVTKPVAVKLCCNLTALICDAIPKNDANWNRKQ